MIYLLEDDASIRELITYTLNSQGLEALGLLSHPIFGPPCRRSPSLILLDIMLPEEDGLHILKRLRSSFLHPTPSHYHADGKGERSTIQCWDWTAVRTTTFPNPSA